MRFWICQECRRLFWSARRACDRCGKGLLEYNHADGEYFVKTLGFSQVGVPAVSALEESLDTLFGRQVEKDRQAEKDAQEALKRSPVKKEEKKSSEPAVPWRDKTVPEKTSQQQKEREEQLRKLEEERRRRLRDRQTRERPAAENKKEEANESKIPAQAPKHQPREEKKTVNVRETLSKLGLRKKGISVE